MRIWSIVAALMMATSFAVKANEKPVNLVEISNSALFLALQDIRKTLNSDRTRFSFENGQSSKNCLEYLNLLSTSLPSETIRNSEVRSEYLLCDSVRIISSEPFLAEKKNLTRHIAQTLFENLDLRTFPSSLRNRLDDRKYTLKTLFPGAGKFQGSKLEVETLDHFFKLEVVGVVHHGAGPVRAWVVWVTDEAKGGNYKSYRTIVVTNSENAPGRYVAAMYP